MKRSGRAAFLVKVLALLYAALVTFPVWYYTLEINSIDSNWQYALNYFADKGVVFGRDVVFTYGPFAYLFFPMDVGSNMLVSTLFLIALWAAFLAVLSSFVLRRGVRAAQVVAFAFLITFGMEPLFQFGHNDMFLCFLGLLLVCTSAVEDRKGRRFAAAILISALLFLVKFPDGLLVASSVLSYAALSAGGGVKNRLLALLYPAAGILAASVGIYLLYNPSLSDWASLIRGTLEMAAGYSVGMSDEGPGIELLLAFGVSLLYAALMFILYRADRPAFRLSLAFVLPMLALFKEGFVRQDSVHVTVFFAFSTVFFGLLLLSARLPKRSHMVSALVVGVLLAGTSYVGQGAYFNVLALVRDRGMARLGMVLDYESTKKKLARAQAEEAFALVMSPRARRTIGDEEVAIFPLELAYAAANGLNYSPMPVFQPYAAMTPYLDNLNARHLEDPEAAPRFIVLDGNLGAVDRRSIMTDNPVTWLSFFRWYDIAYSGVDEYSVMERRKAPRFGRAVPVERHLYGKDEIIEAPFSDRLLLAKIDMELTLKGKLMKVFFRVPEVDLVMYSGAGKKHLMRVVPDTLVGGVIVNAVPRSLREVNRLFREGDAAFRAAGFRLVGKGMGYYKDEVVVEFLEVPDVEVRPGAP